MYSHEIDSIMKQYQYRIPSSVYIDICMNSSQIQYIARKGNETYFISTNDDYEWYFDIYCDSETF